jgi:phosphohistidine phosphatase
MLYILRHGQAEAKADSPDKTDEGRRITMEGSDQIRSVCELARKLNANPNVFLSSPLVRAKQSAEIARKVFGSESELRIENCLEPESEPTDVYSSLSELKRSDSVLLVTHIPIMGKLIFDIIGCHPNMILENGALAAIESKALPTQDTGTLVWLLPKTVSSAQ